MNKRQFFLHSGYARILEAGFMVLGVSLFVLFAVTAVRQVSAREPVVGVEERLAGSEEIFLDSARATIVKSVIAEAQIVNAQNESKDTLSVGSRQQNVQERQHTLSRDKIGRDKMRHEQASVHGVLNNLRKLNF